ncbi:hypothetical protein D3C83_122910 [compost metagenome]
MELHPVKLPAKPSFQSAVFVRGRVNVLKLGNEIIRVFYIPLVELKMHLKQRLFKSRHIQKMGIVFSRVAKKGRRTENQD